MKTKSSRSNPAGSRRHRAAARALKPPAPTPPLRPDADPRRLLHELEVHQIELETQNAELHRTRIEVEAALERYTELYDFAPVGYLSLDPRGLIQEANLTAATMLGVARSRLCQRRLAAFVAPESRATVDAFLHRVFAGPGKHACEALLLSASGATSWVDLQASSTPGSGGERTRCQVAVSDIAARKRAEETQRHVELLAAANKEANREIARRRAVEATLRKTEQAQRRMLEESRELQAQLRHLTHRILLAQEEERKRISRELHDEIAQIMTGIKVQLAALAESASVRPWELRQRIARTRRLIGKSIGAVHRFARDLRPALLDDLGLVPALRSYLKEVAGRKKLSIRFSADVGVNIRDNVPRTVLYRVAQEALTNVVRHARASLATVRLRKMPGAVRLEIHDDGRSFPAARLLASPKNGRLGLLGMRERVEMIGGHFTIESTPGAGTTVIAEISMASAGEPEESPKEA